MGLMMKKTPRVPQRLPTGTFTVDAQGRVVSSTVPQSVPGELVQEIGESVVSVFQGARKANVPFSEMVAQYATFKITAREMRGGAIIFLSPKAPQWKLPSP
jgi:hypothetical protein